MGPVEHLRLLQRRVLELILAVDRRLPWLCVPIADDQWVGPMRGQQLFLEAEDLSLAAPAQLLQCSSFALEGGSDVQQLFPTASKHGAERLHGCGQLLDGGVLSAYGLIVLVEEPLAITRRFFFVLLLFLQKAVHDRDDASRHFLVISEAQLPSFLKLGSTHLRQANL